MINIKLDKPQKFNNNILVSCCAFISFDYRQDIVDYLKGLNARFYNAKTKEWEVPVDSIVGFCNHFENDEIHITGTYTNLQKKQTDLIPADYKFKTKPFAHQLDGVQFALNSGKFLLCDEQGLGKTKQVIDWVGCLGNKINKVLIICGVNSLKYNWANEIEVHSEEQGWVLGTRYRKNGKLYEGNTADKMQDLLRIDSIQAKYIITNIETLRAGAKKISARKYTFPVAEEIQKLCEAGKISLIAADEIHKMKNPTSLQGRAFLKLQAEYMCAMSGTPLMNNPLDLYTPLKWLGYEQHSYYQFKMFYCVMGGFNNAEVVGYRNLDELRNLVQAVMLRRLKTEVLDLPPKIHKIEYVDMTPKQAQIYKEVQNGIISHLQQVRMSNNPLSMLIRLRQATGYTGIISNVVEESAKMNRLVELVDEITTNGKVVVFSNWTEITSVIKQKLSKYKPAYITGATNANERLVEVDKFQNNKDCKVIVGTIGAMGTGLTLTAAQDVIFMDSPWNRALKDQAEDRCHRIGTNGTVSITTLCCKNTIDERIEELVEKKGRMSDALVDGKLSDEDLNFLLS